MLSNVSDREEGVYRCFAVNSEGSAEVRVRVEVTGGGAVGTGEIITIQPKVFKFRSTHIPLHYRNILRNKFSSINRLYVSSGVCSLVDVHIVGQFFFTPCTYFQELLH